MNKYAEKETRRQMSTANELGIPANGYGIYEEEAEQERLDSLYDYSDAESRAIGAIADEYMTLVSFGGGETSYDETTETTAALAVRFNEMMEQLRGAKTVEDCNAIFGEFGSLGKMKSVREYAKLKTING